MRSRKQETNSPRCFLPALRKVGVAGWKRPETNSASQGLVAARQRQRYHTDAVLIPFQIPFSVEGLQRIGRVVFESPEECREAEFLRIGMVEEIADEVEGILVQHCLLVIAFTQKVIELFAQIVKEHRVLVHVLKKVLARSQPIPVQLNPAILIVKVQHRIQRMVIQHCCVRLLQGPLECQRVQNLSNPCLTLTTSSPVPINSKR